MPAIAATSTCCSTARRSTKDVSAVEARLRQEAGDAPLMDDLLSSTSHVLSEAGKGVGFAIAPPNAQALFQRIEFVPLSGSRILVVDGRQRQPGVAEDRGHRRSGEHVGAGAGRELPELGILRAHAGRSARRRDRAAEGRALAVRSAAGPGAAPGEQRRSRTSIGRRRSTSTARRRCSKRSCRPAAFPPRR